MLCFSNKFPNLVNSRAVTRMQTDTYTLFLKQMTNPRIRLLIHSPTHYNTCKAHFMHYNNPFELIS